jgi:methionine-rich copper-binding protein CopC
VSAPVRALAALLLAVLPVLAMPRAEAHAGLVSSAPAADAVLTAAPAEVRLTFTEALQEPAYVVVTAPDGTRSPGEARVEGADSVQPTCALADAPAEGTWRVAYRVVSADGHPVTGELAFTVDPPAGGASQDGGTLEEPEAPAPAPTAAPAEAPAEGFWARHDGHVLLGGGLLVAAAALVQVSRRSRT